MTKTKTKIVALLLTVVMSLGLSVPAFAAERATRTISISVDDIVTQTYAYQEGSAVKKIRLYAIDQRAVEDVVVRGDGYNAVHFNFRDGTSTGVLPGGTEYTIYIETDINGFESLYFSTGTGIMDDITIDVASTDTAYTISANSGIYGSNSNLGANSAATCAVDSEIQVVSGGDAFVVTYMPAIGYDITCLNIRRSANIKPNLVTLANGTRTYTVEGRTYEITKIAGGQVTVRGAATTDLFVTALTTVVRNKAILAVTTDGNCTANINELLVDKGYDKTVEFIPDAGYTITSIFIDDNGRTEEIKPFNNEISLNNQRYTVERRLDGSVLLTIPEMSHNIAVHAVASNTINLITVIDDRSAGSHQAGVNIVTTGDMFTVTYTPLDGTSIQSITCRTAAGSYTAYDGESIMVIGGTRYPIIYGRDGSMTIRLDRVFSNMVFSVNSKSYAHRVTVKTDLGSKADFDSDMVYDGPDLDVVITPAEDKYSVKTLVIRYGDTRVTADVTKDKYVRVNGNRWYISVDKNGIVTLQMTGVREDVAVTAATDYDAHNNLLITRHTDPHSHISFTGSNPFTDDESTIITVEADNNYVLGAVSFETGTHSVSIGPFDGEFTLAGMAYEVKWVNNGELSVEFPALPGSITVTSKSVRGTREDAPSAERAPEEPAVQEPTRTVHNVYMVGRGDRYFGAEDNLTRAEAVTLLTRAIDGLQDSSVESYRSGQNYMDVLSNAWYAGYVNYAATSGYLTALSSGGMFSPDVPITRAEFLALLCKFQGIDVSNAAVNTGYLDVSAGHWAAKYISYATSKNWVGGYGNGLFMPDGNVTRAEICTMTNHVLGRAADNSYAIQAGSFFTDVPVTHWAFCDVFEASRNHVAVVSEGAETWIF